MIILEGNITNKVISGANGDFSVGNFQSTIGQFKIRSTLLDQFDEGEYQVRVTVKKIDLRSYMSKRNGIIITEMELDIHHLEMIKGDIKTVQQESIEPDASIADESLLSDSTRPDKNLLLTQSKNKAPAQKDSKAEPTEKPESSADNTDDLRKLFGHLWPLGDEVKLDTTLPRPLFIKQKSYMARFYNLDIKTQIWSRKP